MKIVGVIYPVGFGWKRFKSTNEVCIFLNWFAVIL